MESGQCDLVIIICRIPTHIANVFGTTRMVEEDQHAELPQNYTHNTWLGRLINLTSPCYTKISPDCLQRWPAPHTPEPVLLSSEKSSYIDNTHVRQAEEIPYIHCKSSDNGDSKTVKGTMFM